ncbi:MAG: glycoside hydrolase family 3 N-terminal domain-containing protein [Ginsengibacter sp.]
MICKNLCTKYLKDKKQFLFLVCLLMIVCISSVMAQTNNGNEAKINALVKQMTLEEKVGQTAQVAIDVLGSTNYSLGTYTLDQKKLDTIINIYKIGSVLNTPGALLSPVQWSEVISSINTSSQKNRLKIPVIYGLDNIHGVNYVKGATLFPQPIGQAATWNRQLVFNGAAVAAYESRAAGVPWTFSPTLDLGTNPLWSRIWENYGEDPYLSGQLGIQAVKGFQEPLGSKEKIAVSLKHYMAYSDPKSGKDRTDAWIPEHYLREYHLPPYEAAVKAGARTVMVNSALINGVPTHINKHVLTDILKTELGFTGFIVTDWQDIENIYRRDRIVRTNKEAIMLAINAGIDMAMIPFDYKGYCADLIALVKEGKVSIDRINDAVKRILRVKYELDLFNTPVTNLSSYPKFASVEFEKASYNTAAESITLLKNTGNILPFLPNKKVLITGPNANSMRTLNGGWTYNWQGDRTDEYAQKYNTILEALAKKIGGNNVIFEQGVSYKMKGKYFEDSILNIDGAIKSAANVDYILLCLGENSYTETPGNLNDLSLSDNQIELANAMIKTGKPVILILNEGRPRIIHKIEPGMSAIIDTYLPGNFGADALADILAGDVNPSGKLPLTYPRYTNSLTGYIHKISDGDGNPQGGEFSPQFPFGFGLSYTTFGYSALAINKQNFSPDETLTVSVTVKNTGNRDGMEVVQLFISDLYASLAPDVKRLRGFEKISLKPGESRVVEFKVPLKQLAFVNLNNKKQLEEGDFKIEIHNQTATFKVNKTVTF